MPSPTPSSHRDTTRLRLLQLAGRVLPSRSPSPRTRKVLLLRPDHIGDVLLNSPAIALLRASLPETQLTYIVGPWSIEAASNGPPVDELRTLEYPGFTRRRNATLVAPYAVLTREVMRLRRQRFDVAVVFRPDHWWGALLALAAGIPLRVGAATPETAPLLTHTYTRGCSEHATEQSLAIARRALQAIGVIPAELETVPQFSITPTARQEAERIWRQHGLGEARTVALQPSAGAPLKSWPVYNWARLADSLLDEGVAVLLTGAPGDHRLLEHVLERMSRPGAAISCGQSLSATAALFERCALAITVDGGAGHLAAAVGTPTLRLYGPAPPSIYGPWPRRAADRVLMTDHLSCVPCGHLESPPCGARELPACMLALGVEDVMNAARGELSQG